MSISPSFDTGALRIRLKTAEDKVKVHMSIHLLYTHLTVISAFSLTLNTIAFDYSTLGWFGTSTCIAVPAGPPPSSVQHSCLQVATLPGRAFVAHCHLHIECSGLLSLETPGRTR